MEHIWTMLMHKILQNHLLCAFVANLKIGAIYALYPESFCDKNLAIRKVFAFCDSAGKRSGNVVKSIKRMSAPVPLNGRYQFSLSSSSLKDFFFLRRFFWQKFITWRQQSIVANPAAIILIARCLNLFSTY